MSWLNMEGLNLGYKTKNHASRRAWLPCWLILNLIRVTKVK